jgi:hypothetical protein
MKEGLKHIIGKEISAVVVAGGEGVPKQQVFLVFADGTRFEFHGESFSCCGGPDRAEGIEGYVESGGGRVMRVYGDVRVTAVAAATASAGAAEVEPLEGKLFRDLAAWQEAKGVIARARGRG